MGYDCWAQVKITNRSNVTLKFSRSSHVSGKFYEAPNQNNEISPEDLNSKTISGRSDYTFGASGRQAAAYGCEGQFDLVDNNGNTVCTAIYYSPHGTSYNNFRIEVPSPQNWGFGVNGGYFGNDKALGEINLYISKL